MLVLYLLKPKRHYNRRERKLIFLEGATQGYAEVEGPQVLNTLSQGTEEVACGGGRGGGHTGPLPRTYIRISNCNINSKAEVKPHLSTPDC